jgi:integrase
MNPKEIKNLLLDNVSRLEKEGKKGSYVKGIIKSVKSWLSFNDIQTPKVRIAKANSRLTVEDEGIPTHEELKKILNVARTRGRVSIALMSQSGLRPQVLGNGSSGLMIKDLPDLEIKNGKVSFKNIPAIIIVRAEISKISHQYLTFLSSEGCEYLLAHLQERLERGEELIPISSLLGVDHHGKSFKGVFPTTKTTMSEVRQAIRGAGFTWRPYVLRHYFATMLDQAEAYGKIKRTWSQFFMGQTGDMMARYTTNKGRLPPETIESMRSAYRESENNLMTSPKVETILEESKHAQLDMAKRLLSTIYPDLNLDIKIKDREIEVKRTLTSDESLDLVLESAGNHRKNNDQNENFRVIKVGELEDFLNKNPDWKPKQAVNSDKFLIERIH